MPKIGLKYISPGKLGLPAFNGGKWNLASNFNNDFRRVLNEVGIEESDVDSEALFFKFIAEGTLVTLARRCSSVSENVNSYEALWMFLPYNVDLPPGILTEAITELRILFNHPEAFISRLALEDNIPDFFKKEFEEKIATSNDVRMSGNRLGYVEFLDRSELDLILSTGFSEHYSNFGLILLTDNPAPVESALPRIFLPELTIHRQIQSSLKFDNMKIEEVNKKEEGNEEELDINDEGEGEEGVEEYEENEKIIEVGEEEERMEEEEENESRNVNLRSEEKLFQEREEGVSGDGIVSHSSFSKEGGEIGKGSSHSLNEMSWHSFFLGFTTASVIFIILLLILYK